MAHQPVTPRPRQVRVVLSTTALLSFMSVRKATALALAELGVGAFFVAGAAQADLGAWGPWFVLGAALFGLLVRAADIESWALFIPGGAVGRAEQAFGPRVACMTAAAVLVERLLLAALAAVVIGHSFAGLSEVIAMSGRFGRLPAEELAGPVAVVVLGALWLRARMGLDLPSDIVARGVWVAIAGLAAIVVWGAVTPAGTEPAQSLLALPLPSTTTGWSSLVAAITAGFAGMVTVLPVIGGGDALSRGAHEFPPPRLQALRRTGWLVVFFSLAITTALAVQFARLVPFDEVLPGVSATLPALTHHLLGPEWAHRIAGVLMTVTALLFLVPAAHVALADAEQTLRRLVAAGAVPERLAVPHPRFGTFARAVDVATLATMVVLIVSGGRVLWLSHAYAGAIAITLIIRLATLVRLRRRRPGPRPFSAPLTIRTGPRAVPIGLILPISLVAIATVAAVAAGDVPVITTLGLFGVLTALLAARRRTLTAPGHAADVDEFELLPSADLTVKQAEARPGNILVAVRHPHLISHVGEALEVAGDRDVVVMTVRLIGVDVDDDSADEAEPTPNERRLFSQVVALAERYHRPVRLLIVPAQSVFDAFAATISRLRSSEVFVGESSTLSADEQARRLGEAWEQVSQPADAMDVRLVIHHHSGRTAAYHLGAHPPALSPGDLDLIHRLWLDAVKSVGPHVHHHDVVRAALTQMEQQLSGPQRDDAVDAIRRVARPADELAAVVRARDFSRLRDMVRNRHASDLASVLTDLSIEDQVVVFRLLPRKDASAVFEYLSYESQEALLKAMAQEDVAALLNNMAPDDRTEFLEELPAAATRQLLALLTPAERAVALTLLGYPEGSIGRLMTPQYVAVREAWTIREVLDYIRAHGQDSETLNVIYVVDEQGSLIDDIRIREFLLRPLDDRVSSLMDRSFVALKATDDEQTAVAMFRKYDRSALPVTDTAGMLIGIVTIDDVLDVAETAATEAIQRIGGSEALDEPYMEIAFFRMVQKRAGWLTALFLGEMLTATAMGVFEAEIAKAVTLALFVPLIISSGGNSGSQASTLVIRALALGEVTLGDWWRVMRREILAGLALGAILASIGFLRITIWSQFSHIYGAHYLLVAVTVALALIGVVLWGTLVGALLPFLLRRLGFDPATSSAPFVATLVDVTGLVIYFSVAMVILRGSLL